LEPGLFSEHSLELAADTLDSVSGSRSAFFQGFATLAKLFGNRFRAIADSASQGIKVQRFCSFDVTLDGADSHRH